MLRFAVKKLIDAKIVSLINKIKQPWTVESKCSTNKHLRKLYNDLDFTYLPDGYIFHQRNISVQYANSSFPRGGVFLIKTTENIGRIIKSNRGKERD